MPRTQTGKSKRAIAPVIVVQGDEAFRKARVVREALDSALPPDVDRSMAYCEYDGEQSEDAGGPTLAGVLDDLGTLPFLADRRVVLVRSADRFITAHREALERYCASPHGHALLILECRSLPKTTRLYKAVVAAGGRVEECKKLGGRGLVDFVLEESAARDKRLDRDLAARLVDLVGQDQHALAGEVEKLALFVGDRKEITRDDVSDLVGLSREEKIFAVMDCAGAGRLSEALRLWRNVLATDPHASFRAVGGIAFVLRRWLAAQEMLAAGESLRAIAPKMMMWGRERELDTILRRLSVRRIQQELAALAELDAQAKVGLRSIDTGIEAMLVRVGGDDA